MTWALRAGIARAVLLLAVTASAADLLAQDSLPIRARRLSTTEMVVDADTVLRAPIRHIIAAPTFAAFIGGRNVWIKLPGRVLVPLAQLVQLPSGADWFGPACLAGPRLLLAAASYPEAQREHDEATPRGGFRRGPTPLGLLLVDFAPPGARLITAFSVDSSRDGPDVRHLRVQARTEEWARLPEHFDGEIQSCSWDGRQLTVGAYGALARLDLARESAALLQFDAEMQFNRTALLVEPGTIWYYEDEGGADGGCLIKLTGLSHRHEYCLLNRNGSEIGQDATVRFRGRLLTSSAAGIVEVVEHPPAYVRYTLSTDSSDTGLYDLSVLGSSLWAMKNDGWVRVNLPKQSAVLYRLRAAKPVPTYAIALVEGRLYVATDSALVRPR